MKTFNSFLDFAKHLSESIMSGKDVYVFGNCYDDDTDYMYYVDDGCHCYSINPYIDINTLQSHLHETFIDCEHMDLVIVLDYVCDETDDYARLFIFKRV